MSKLTIYKASAGSGKTFRLTGEYLKLIFNPQRSFKNILAVTFTNKATGEMRERILKELHTLATGCKSKYAKSIKTEYKLNDSELKKKAKFLLSQILHNYSRFNVNTIDSFFQKILKAFVRETGLNSGFNIELNIKQILELSIDRFFDKANNNPIIKEWLSNYAIQKIEDGRNWDIEKDIFSFSIDAFNEVFFGFSEAQLDEFGNMENFKLYKKELNKTIKAFIGELQNYGTHTLQLLDKNSLDIKDFAFGKSGVAGFLSKLQNISYKDIKEPGTRVLNAYNSPDGIEGWCSKTSQIKTEIQQCVNGGLHNILQNVIDHFNANFEQYNTALAIYKSIDVFAVITEVFNQLNRYCNEKNIFLLPFASPLLSKMIGSNDAPFIYEKTGEHLRYFMIDEFQDTSKLQWNNFLPLFLNGISQGDESLVVGDVKQSIYRWRNGDWTILNSKLAKTFELFGVKHETLNDNWRSAPEIVNFNNWVFDKIAGHAIEYMQSKDAPEQIADEFYKTIQDIYSSAKQNIPEQNRSLRGMVNVKFCEEEKDKDENTQWYLDKMTNAIIDLLDKGIRPKDIAILVRKKSEGAQIAKHLMEYAQEYPEKREQLSFISNDSVLLESSSVILLIIALLEYLANTNNNESKAAIVYYWLLFANTPTQAAEKLTEINFTNNTQFLTSLPTQFAQNLDELKRLPFSLLVNRLLAIFVFSNKTAQISQQLPFIHTFQDIVLNYTNNSGSDISGFLTWWKEFGADTPIKLSDEQDAIHIITIHKSKGLEYKAVIIPFANWGLDQLPKHMWCKTPDGFNHFSVVPVKYSSSLAKTQFKNEYWVEKTMALIDNLNLLYVAFTRAATALYIFAPMPSKKGTINKVSDLLYNIFDLPESENSDWNAEQQTFTVGSIVKGAVKSYDAPITDAKFPELQNSERNLRLRLSAADYFINDDGDLSKTVNMGSVYHKIMERIVVYNDIETAVNSVLNEGFIDKAEAEMLIKKLKHILLKDNVKSWFDNSYRILNELSIIIKDGKQKRPDRVMIGKNKAIVVDYKFTTEHSKSHLRQVKEYMDYISAIENKETIGFVWYVLEDKLIEVKTV